MPDDERRKGKAKCITDAESIPREYNLVILCRRTLSLRSFSLQLTQMLIAMDHQAFCKSVKHSILDQICHRVSGTIQKWRVTAGKVQKTAMVQRRKLQRAERSKKLALLDMSALKTKYDTTKTQGCLVSRPFLLSGYAMN